MRRLFLSLLPCVLMIAGIAPALAGASIQYRVIPVYGGATTTAVVITPEGQGSGKFPLIVMPASWGAPEVEYVGIGTVLANQGYVVVSYTARGFYAAGGENDIAGAATIEDVSSVIDWALANTPSSIDAIGASGVSYGAGISLLAAERDPRIKAVAAFSAWTDLAASLYPNRTVNAQAAIGLLAAGDLLSKPGPLLRTASAAIATGDFDGAAAAVLPAAPERSAITDVDRLNENGTAVLIANGFGDSLFPPMQLVGFHERLTGPKQLLLANGDHGTTEGFGVLGLPNDSYDTAKRWFDHYLKGIDNGIERESPVRLKSQLGHWSGYPDWSSVQADATRFGLSQPTIGLFPPQPLPTGNLIAATTRTGWSYRINTGMPTAANSGIILVSGALQQFTGLAPAAWVPSISRSDAAVWSGPIYSTSRRISGAPKLHITVTPSNKDASLFVYLYSEDVFGTGVLLTHKPYSLRNATPGVAQTLDIELEAMDWELPAYSKLTLVIGTVDLRYAGISKLFDGVTFSSPASSPSTLSVPLH